MHSHSHASLKMIFALMIEINMFILLSSSWSIDAITYLLGFFYAYVATLDMICMIVTCESLCYAMIDVWLGLFEMIDVM